MLRVLVLVSVCITWTGYIYCQVNERDAVDELLSSLDESRVPDTNADDVFERPFRVLNQVYNNTPPPPRTRRPDGTYGEDGDRYDISDQSFNPLYPQSGREPAHFIRIKEPTYFVVASRTVRPSTVYRVMVTLLQQAQHLDVRASLSRDGVEVTNAATSMLPGEQETLLLKVPATSVFGHYKLRVEGNHKNTVGGTVFLNETDLSFSNRFLTIVISPNRAVYTGGQAVMFRAILLTTDLKPFDDVVNVYVLDPDGYILRRWISKETNVGVVTGTYQLPSLPKMGYWKIQVEARGQVEEKKIKVEKFFIPQFETFVMMPAFFLDTDEAVTADISAGWISEKTTKGNATVWMYAKQIDEPNTLYRHITSEQVEWMEGEMTFAFPMRELRQKMGRLDGVQVKVEAEVMDFFYGDTVGAFCESRIMNGTVNLKFLGSSPMVFKPGMPFEGQIVVSYHDEVPLSAEKLASSTLRIQPYVILEAGGQVDMPEVIIPRLGEYVEKDQSTSYSWDKSIPTKDEYMYLHNIDEEDYRMKRFVQDKMFNAYRTKGILRFKFDIPQRASQLKLSASYQDLDGDNAQTDLTALAYYSPLQRYISIITSTTDAVVGEYVVCHIKTNFVLDSFTYMIISKDLLLYANQEEADDTTPTITTISIPVSPDMAPSFKMVVFHTTADGEVLSDSLFVPVDGIGRHQVEFTLNQVKDHSKNTVEAHCVSTPGSFFGTTVQRGLLYALQAGNEISKARVLQSLHSFENFTRSIHKVTFTSREGDRPDTTEYFTSMNYGVDANRTFAFAGLVVFTDAAVPIIPGAEPELCNRTRGYLPCLTGDCYLEIQHCNGRKDCRDGSDEADCPPAHNIDEARLFRLSRRSRFNDFYDDGDGDWAWKNMNIGDTGDEFITYTVPVVTDDWYVGAFSMSKDLGFGMIDMPLLYTTTRPFFMVLEAPTSVHRGEQVGIRCMLFNRENYEILAMVILHDSPDYKFIHVEPDGIVSSYRPRMSHGEHHHLVPIGAESEVEIHIPVSPQVEQGTINVEITAVTQIARDAQSLEIEVTPEGVQINKHTSRVLDLKNRAYVLQFFDIFVEESPIVPYEYWRRYVSGSPQATVSLCGDVVGPAFPEMPVGLEVLMGRDGKGTEKCAFDFASNLWTLHYLRLTNQLQWKTAKAAFEAMNVQYACIMRRFSKEGWLKAWDMAEPNVWLTAWVMRIFRDASFQDWENYFYVESQVLSQGIRWVLHYQNETTGAFHETEWYRSPLDMKMDPRSTTPDGTTVNRNISLTAHVLISLHINIDTLQGDLRSLALNAKLLATRYLERQLPQLTHPFEIAITAYALTICNSVEKETAFTMLDDIKREEEGFVYWSPTKVPTNNIRYENNRPFLQAKDNLDNDALAVETTSYALLVYLIREGVDILREKMVLWLNSMRLADGGFISTTDTVVALQALTEYSYIHRLRDITNMEVTIEAPSTPGLKETLRLGNGTMATMNTIDIPNVYGHINIIAQGAGQAIVQLDVNFGVDYVHLLDYPPTECFELDIREYYGRWRNKSLITIQSCMRWTLTSESPVSGAAVLEVQIPSGYGIEQPDANKIIESRIAPSLKDVKALIPGKTVWFFDYIPSNMTTCFNHTVRRRFPVANMTRFRSGILYDYYRPERFRMTMFNSTPLYVLNICEVCGSYQCPYCPFYSAASLPAINSVLLALNTLILTYIWAR